MDFSDLGYSRYTALLPCPHSFFCISSVFLKLSMCNRYWAVFISGVFTFSLRAKDQAKLPKEKAVPGKHKASLQAYECPSYAGETVARSQMPTHRSCTWL